MVPLLALFAAATAHAGVFQHKTMHAPWPDRVVLQEQVLPKGWWEVGVGLEHLSSVAYRDADGSVTAWEHGATWQHSVAELRLAHGFSRTLTLYARLPAVRAHLHNERGGRVTTVAPGDAHTGVILQPWLARTITVAFRLDLKAPSGIEWPHELGADPNSLGGFATGTGITNVGAFAQGRWHLGRIARVDLSAGYVLKWPNIVGYVVEVDGFGNGWLDPGDEVRVNADVAFEVAPGFAIRADGQWSWRNWYRMGVSGEGLKFADWFYVEEPASFVDVGVALDADPVERFGFTLGGSYQVLGGPTTTFGHLGLHEFSPQPGVTVRAAGRVRW